MSSTHSPRSQPADASASADPTHIHTGEKGENPFSGFLIVRLDERLSGIESDTLEGLAKEAKAEGLAEFISSYDITETRPVIRSLSADQIRDLEKRASQTDLPPLRSLTTYWRLDVRHLPGEGESLVEEMSELYEVDQVYQEFGVTDPMPVNASDDPYAASQGYLDAAPEGIDARWAWTQTNSTGAGVGIVDLEQGWFPNHEDLLAASPTLVYGDNRDGVGSYKGNHGTAVLGEMVARDNTLGVVGIAPDVSSVRMTSHYDAGTNTALHVADAILAVLPTMDPGDVLLLEVQRFYLPTEVDDADFDAIRLATALGIIVVEASGNGNNDLDLYTNGSGITILNRNSSGFRESGAIMMGASKSALPHDRAWFSNFGSRIDCYGWGEDVVTCGYGDLDPGSGDETTYTNTFSGTSSASPIVAGAALILQGMYEATTGTRLSPGQMRSLLANPVTGTPQGPNTAGNIGVMPDLRLIITNTLSIVPDVYLRDNVGDTGAIPSSGGISASPDVIVRPAPVGSPSASFGQGSGTENSSTLGYEVEAGQDNYIYVRMKNRGGLVAQNVRATVYWSEVSTLITPDMWNEIGTTTSVDVPQGNTLVVTNPVVWDSSDIPATGHYCFVAVLDHPMDPAPPLPSPTDWQGFTDFIRNHNNVTWRNFNVVDDLPDAEDPDAEFPVVIGGAPDQSREFDLEVVQHLPEDVTLQLEVPLVLLAPLMEDRDLKVEVDKEENVGRIHLPRQRNIVFRNVKLTGGERYPARFIVPGSRNLQKGGHSFSIRQHYEGQQVGGVHWEFHLRDKVVLDRVYYEYEESRFDKVYLHALRNIAKQLKESKEMRLLVVGHSDEKEESQYKGKLAEKRAHEAASVLMERFDMDKGRIEVTGVGACAPAAPTRSKDAHALNRRVEFISKM
jgi:serine protease